MFNSKCATTYRCTATYPHRVYYPEILGVFYNIQSLKIPPRLLVTDITYQKSATPVSVEIEALQGQGATGHVWLR